MKKSAVWGALHGLPAHKQMRTPWFILITLLTVLQMLRMNYFIATIRSQYEYMLGTFSPKTGLSKRLMLVALQLLPVTFPLILDQIRKFWEPVLTNFSMLHSP